MATLNSTKRNTSGILEAGDYVKVRRLEVPVNFATDFLMGTATDDINLMTLPGGAVVMAVLVQQVAAGTGTGTVVGRVGTTTVTATLASTDAAGTVPATVPAALPLVVPLAGAQLNLLGATAVRTTGKARVVIYLAEGDATPREPTTTDRDAIG